jgi:hypothetical protein
MRTVPVREQQHDRVRHRVALGQELGALDQDAQKTIREAIGRSVSVKARGQLLFGDVGMIETWASVARSKARRRLRPVLPFHEVGDLTTVSRS